MSDLFGLFGGSKVPQGGMGGAMGFIPQDVIDYLSRPQPATRMPEYAIPPELMEQAQNAAPMPNVQIPDGFQPALMPQYMPDDIFIIDRPKSNVPVEPRARSSFAPIYQTPYFPPVEQMQQGSLQDAQGMVDSIRDLMGRRGINPNAYGDYMNMFGSPQQPFFGM